MLLIRLIGLSLLIAARADAAVLISVEPSPSIIPADGKSCCQILVTVLGQSGARVSDGTEVRLNASAGDITPVVHTADGRAVGILTSATSPQIASITAMSDGSSGSTRVEFASSDYEEASASARTIRMAGGSLAYSVDEDTVVGSSGVTIEFEGLTIRATGAQVSQRTGEIRAQGDVTVEKDDQTLTADMLVCDMRGGRLRLMDLNDQSSARTLDMRKLETVPSRNTETDPSSFSPLMDVGGRTWIVCGRLVLIPGQRILFFKAKIHVGDAKVITVPYYSYSYERRQSILQQVRYTSSEGMIMDLPYYYRVADSGTGALKLRYAANGTEFGSSYRPRRGASIGIEEDYSFGDRSRGRVFVDSVVDATRAFEATHHIEFGNALVGARADVSARYQPSSSYAKDAYNASISMMGSLRDYTFSLSAYLGGSRFERFDFLHPETLDYVNQSSRTVRAVFRPKRQILSRSLGSISPSLTLGYGNLWSGSGGSTSPCMYQTLELGIYRSAFGTGKTVLGLDGATAVTMTARGDTGASLRMRPTLRRNWSSGSVSLSYTLSLQSGTTDSISSLGMHQLGCSLFLYNGAKWSANLSANYGLDSQRLNLYSTAHYRLGKGWEMRSSYSLYRYVYRMNGRPYSYSSPYVQVGIYHPIGSYEIGLAWSPNGQNYGTDRDKRVWLELGGSAF